MEKLLEDITQLTVDVKNQTTTPEDAETKLNIILKRYLTLKNQQTENLKTEFLEFLGVNRAQKHLREMFYGYLGTNNADDKKDRNDKLFVHEKLQELLTVMGK
jgi:hypothetical protein